MLSTLQYQTDLSLQYKHMNNINKILNNISDKEKANTVYELTVLRSGEKYSMVGKIMNIHNGSVKLAFSSKDNVVIDYVEMDVQEIQYIQHIPEDSIQNLGIV